MFDDVLSWEDIVSPTEDNEDDGCGCDEGECEDCECDQDKCDNSNTGC